MQRDIRKGWSLIQSSAKSGNGSGWLMQGHCYRFGYGVKKNLASAVDRYKRAINTPDFTRARYSAHYELATMYETGERAQPRLFEGFRELYLQCISI